MGGRNSSATVDSTTAAAPRPTLVRRTQTTSGPTSAPMLMPLQKIEDPASRRSSSSPQRVPTGDVALASNPPEPTPMSTRPTARPNVPGRTASETWPGTTMTAEERRTSSGASTRSARQAPRMVDGCTPPPWAPTSPVATAWSIAGPPSATEKYTCHSRIACVPWWENRSHGSTPKRSASMCGWPKNVPRASAGACCAVPVAPARHRAPLLSPRGREIRGVAVLAYPGAMTVVAPAAEGSKAVLVTAEELLDVPDDGLRRELVDGVVRTMAPAGAMHGRAGADLLFEVMVHVRANSLGAVYTAETGFRIARDPDTVRAPDVAFVRADRVAEADVPGFPDLAPDLVAEVVSPGDRATEVTAKALAWLDAGVRLVWLVDRPTRSVTVHSRGATRVLRDDDVLDGGDVLPGFTLPLSRLWG